MPAENLEEQGLEKNPDLALAQLKFKLTLSDFKNDAAIKDELMQAIEKDSKAHHFSLWPSASLSLCFSLAIIIPVFLRSLFPSNISTHFSSPSHRHGTLL